MYVTTRYIGTERGKMNYLFLLLTEDYIEENQRIAEGLVPLLTRFAEEVGDKGVLVKPFRGKEEETLGDALRKKWTEQQIKQMRGDLPAILVIDKDFDEFEPIHSNYIYISLRESMDDFGNVRVFQLQELLSLLATACKSPSLFVLAREYLNKQNNKSLWEATELKPEFFGFSFDLKKGIEFLKRMIPGRQLYMA